MINVRLTFNTRCLASQFFRINGVCLPNCRNLGTKDDETKVAFSIDSFEDEESIKSRESAIELKRNKSELFQSDYNRQNDKMPYNEPLWDYHESLKYRRRMYGKYGESSNVNPAILWPSKVELAAMKEYEEAAQPFTLTDLIEKVKEKKALREKKILEEENLILEKVKTVKLELLEFHKRVALKKQKALEVMEQKNKLVEQVKKHFGFEMDPKDERFREMLEKLQNEEKKKIKKEKQRLREERKKLILESSEPVEDNQDRTKLS